MNQSKRIARINFERPFELDDPDLLDLASGVEYKMILNWGVFKNENDTSKEHIYGAQSIADVQDFVLLKARSALMLRTKVVIVLIMILNVSYL